MATEYKHLDYNDRIYIASNINKISIKNIAKGIGVTQGTIYRELNKRGSVLWDSDGNKEYVYSAVCAQKEYEEKVSNRGKKQLIQNKKLYGLLKKYIEQERLSPERTIEKLQKEYPKYKNAISVPTLYRYIREGLFYIKDGEVAFEGNKIVFEFSNVKYELKNTKNNRLIAKVITELLPNWKIVFVKVDGDELIIVSDVLRDYFKIVPLTQSNEFPTIMAYEEKSNTLAVISVNGIGDNFDPKKINSFKNNYNDINTIFLRAYNNYNEMFKEFKSIPWNTSIWVKSDPDHLVTKK